MRATWARGDDAVSPETLRGHVNLADRAARNISAQWTSLGEWPDFEDVGPLHAEVHRYSPNLYGLFNVLGNVEEWVLDCDDPNLPGSFKNPNVAPIGGSLRVTHSGSFANAPSRARSARRNDEGGPDYRAARVGLRVSRGLAP